MPNVSHRYVVVEKELFLKREDAEKLIDHAAHLPQPALPPSPNLGGHQVDDGNSGRFQASRQTQMKVRGVGQDRQIRRITASRGQQLAVFAINAGNMRHHFHQAHDG